MKRQYQTAAVFVVPMFAQVNSLPGSQVQSPVRNGDGKTGTKEGGF